MFSCCYDFFFGFVRDEPEEGTFELFSEPEHQNYFSVMHPRTIYDGRLREDESIDTLIDMLKRDIWTSDKTLGFRINENYYKSGGYQLVMVFHAPDKETLYNMLLAKEFTAAQVAYYYLPVNTSDLAGITSTAEAVEKGIIFAGPAAAKPKPAAKTATAMLTAAGTLATPVKDAGDSKQSVTPPSDADAACASAASAV